MATVEIHGPKLPGKRKYLGGAPTLEGDALLGVPAHATAVLKLELATGAVTLDESGNLRSPRTRDGKFKWLRGVRAGSAIYCIPACGDGVLKIEPATGEQRVLGRGELPTGEWMWHGAALGRDGNIYAIPANAERVLKIEPAPIDRVSLVGPRLHPGLKNKWYGGIRAEDGSIWGMPFNAPSALKITPETGAIEEVGAFGRGGYKWHGGTRSGAYIVAIPSHALSVLVIETATGKCELLPTGVGGVGYQWGGAVTDADGVVWAVPSDSTFVLKISPGRSSEVALIGGLSAIRNKWQGGVLGRDGNVYCMPCDASAVLCIHPKSSALSLHGELGDSRHKFQGAYGDPATGTIWSLPESFEHIMKIVPPAHADGDGAVAGAIDTWASTSTVGEAARRVQRCHRRRVGARKVAPPGSASPNGLSSLERASALRLAAAALPASGRPRLAACSRALFHGLLCDERGGRPGAAAAVVPTRADARALRGAHRRRLSASWLAASGALYRSVAGAAAAEIAAAAGGDDGDASARRLLRELTAATPNENASGARTAAAAHACHVRRHLAGRASSLASLLLLDLLHRRAAATAEAACWSDAAEAELAATAELAAVAEARGALLLRKKTLRVLLVGGGRGFEAVALAALAAFVGASDLEIEIWIADRESERRPTAAAVLRALGAARLAVLDPQGLDAEAVKGAADGADGGGGGGGGGSGGASLPPLPRVTSHSIGVDVTQGLGDGANAAVAAVLAEGVDVVVCSHALADAAAAARGGGWRFLVDLGASFGARGGYLLGVDDTHRIWPEAINALREGCGGALGVWLPTNPINRRVALLARLGPAPGGGGSSATAAADGADGAVASGPQLARCVAAAEGAARARSSRGGAAFHDSADFVWEERRETAIVELEEIRRKRDALQENGGGASTTTTSAAAQVARWETHFEKHADAPTMFFKERRSLLQEFPLLATGSLRVLEIGCGTGSSVLPLLRGNPDASVHASDPSAAAVAQMRRQVDAAGFGGRLTSEVQADASGSPCGAVAPASFDVAMAVYTLSAVPGADGDGALLAATAAAVRPGGAVIVRDYGMYDMRHLSDAKSSQRVAGGRDAGSEFLRVGGMYRRYYSLDGLAALAARAGLAVEESRYLCVRLRNERRKLTMDRVYVHAVLRKPAGAGTMPPKARPNPDLCDGNVLRCVPAWCAMLAGR